MDKFHQPFTGHFYMCITNTNISSTESFIQFISRYCRLTFNRWFSKNKPDENESFQNQTLILMHSTNL